MHFPRLPHWLVYVSIVLAMLFAALGRQERVNAPPPPPPLPAGEGKVLADNSSFDAANVVKVTPDRGRPAGAAFSVADSGVWLTAASIVDGCAKAAILVSDGQGIEAKVKLDPTSDVAVLTTAGGAPALPLAPLVPLKSGALGFLPGYPRGRPGELATRYQGPEVLFQRERKLRSTGALVWAEVGRTEGLAGALPDLPGSPVLDGEGRVVGVAIDESPRRGRIYSTTPDEVRRALSAAGVKLPAQAAGQPITADNYGRAADDLRREFRVAQVVCLKA